MCTKIWNIEILNITNIENVKMLCVKIWNM